MRRTWMNPIFHHTPARPAAELNPLVLAYVGDAIYELFIREYVVSRPNHRPNHLHRTAIRYVSARAQAKALESLDLNEQEQDVVRRGRNAKSGTVPKNTDILQYRYSTAFEALLGYLYYAGEFERLRDIMEQSVRIIEGREETAERKQGPEEAAGRNQGREDDRDESSEERSGPGCDAGRGQAGSAGRGAARTDRPKGG